jgi:hypothetical protein
MALTVRQGTRTVSILSGRLSRGPKRHPLSINRAALIPLFPDQERSARAATPLNTRQLFTRTLGLGRPSGDLSIRRSRRW